MGEESKKTSKTSKPRAARLQELSQSQRFHIPREGEFSIFLTVFAALVRKFDCDAGRRE